MNDSKIKNLENILSYATYKYIHYLGLLRNGQRSNEFKANIFKALVMWRNIKKEAILQIRFYKNQHTGD